MPHDKKARLIEVGDSLLFKDYAGKFRVGTVARVFPGAETCDVEVYYTQPSVQAVSTTITAKETELLRKADGSEPLRGAEQGSAHSIIESQPS